MRSFDYARTAPEPPEGALVFAVRLVVAFMGRSYAGARGRRQRFLDGKCRSTRLNPTRLLRHKLTHGRSQSFRTADHRRPGPPRPADHVAWRGADAGLHAG